MTLPKKNPLWYNIGTRMRQKFIIDNCKIKGMAKPKLLDLGCGIGYFSHLLSKNAEVTGIDPDKNAIKWAKQNYLKIKFLVGSALKIPLKKDCFDLVLSTEVIEHVRNDDLFLENIKRVLKHGGIFILTTECNEGVLPISEMCHPKESRLYMNYRLGYKTKELINLLKKHNFKILKIDYSLIFFSKLFMEITKRGYKLIDPNIKSQANITKKSKSFLFKIYKFFFPFILPICKIDLLLKLFLKGSCIMIKCVNIKKVRVPIPASIVSFSAKI